MGACVAPCFLVTLVFSVPGIRLWLVLNSKVRSWIFGEMFSFFSQDMYFFVYLRLSVSLGEED